MNRPDASDFPMSTDFSELPLFASVRDDGPFAQSLKRPTPGEVLIAGLIWKHKGRANPISIAALHEITKFGERQIKAIVEQLMVTHRMRIGARREEPAGYFIVQDAGDLDAAVGPYKSQILSMLRRLRVLDSPHARREFLGQIRLELEGE